MCWIITTGSSLKGLCTVWPFILWIIGLRFSCLKQLYNIQAEIIQAAAFVCFIRPCCHEMYWGNKESHHFTAAIHWKHNEPDIMKLNSTIALVQYWHFNFHSHYWFTQLFLILRFLIYCRVPHQIPYKCYLTGEYNQFWISSSSLLPQENALRVSGCWVSPDFTGSAMSFSQKDVLEISLNPL